MAILNKINEFILIEYDQDLVQIVGSTLTSVNNGSINEVILANPDSDILLTGNTIDSTTVKLKNGKYAVLDKDTAYYYPDVDPGVSINPTTYPDGVRYNKVRIHIMSGYNFSQQDLHGFNLECYLKTSEGDRFLLASHFHDSADDRLIKFNPIPIKISHAIYDKYIDLMIVSPKWLATLTNASAYFGILQGKKLADGNGLVYFDYKSTSNLDIDSGYALLTNTDQQIFGITIDDKFDQLASNIVESSNGDYFEFSAVNAGQSVEDLIYRLNGTTAKNYYLIHDIELYENIAGARVLSDSFTTTQLSNFSIPYRYRPIIMNPAANSFTIVHTIRLYNSSRGDSILKMGSLISNKVGKYGIRMERLNVNVDAPVNIYNKIVGAINVPVINDVIPQGKTHVIYRYVDPLSIIVNNDQHPQITIDPFDNFVIFDVKQEKDSGIKSHDLTVVGDVFELVMFNDQSEPIRVLDSPDQQHKRSNGKLVFKIPKSIANIAINGGFSKFYVISKSSVGDEQSIFDGSIELPTKKKSKKLVSRLTDKLNQ